MSEPPTAGQGAPDATSEPVAATAIPATAPAGSNLWNRIKHRKIVHWMAAYGAAAYTLLHGVEMISTGLGWPHLVVSVTTVLVLVGAPVAALIAWYHGERGLQRISGMELAMFTLLGVIAGSVLWQMARSVGHGNATATMATAASTASGAGADIGGRPVTPAAPRTAVAVLPFSNQTGDEKKDYLGEGLATELINTLNKVPGLTVPAKTSSFAYKGRNSDARQIARDLGVGTLLEGAVQVAGDRIRVTAELVNATDGLHLWSETYDRRFADLFKLQDELSTAIVQALQVNLSASTAIAIKHAAPTKDIEAYKLYLQGSSLVDRGSEENNRDAIKLLKQSVARDPKFARAYGDMANAYMGLFGNVGKTMLEDRANVIWAGERALALDPAVPSAHNALAGVASGNGRWVEMETHDRAAQALAPNDGLVRAIHAAHLSNTGHLSAALAEARIAAALAPTNALAASLIAQTQWKAGLSAEAEMSADRAVALGSTRSSQSLSPIQPDALRRSGRYAEAAEALIKSFDLKDENWVRTAEVTRLVYAALADPAKRPAALAARQRLYPRSPARSADALSPLSMLPCTYSVSAYALLGENAAFTQANQCLDDASENGDVRGSLLTYHPFWSPEFRAFRQDPRFSALIQRIGLMDFYDIYGPPDNCDLKDGKLTCH
jgi:TolB-like protein/Tfp pilus assembly protein PilF